MYQVCRLCVSGGGWVGGWLSGWVGGWVAGGKAVSGVLMCVCVCMCVCMCVCVCVCVCVCGYQEAKDEVHTWEIQRNMYSPGCEATGIEPGPGAWMDVGPYELELSESELDPESPRYCSIP